MGHRHRPNGPDGPWPQPPARALQLPYVESVRLRRAKGQHERAALHDQLKGKQGHAQDRSQRESVLLPPRAALRRGRARGPPDRPRPSWTRRIKEGPTSSRIPSSGSSRSNSTPPTVPIFGPPPVSPEPSRIRETGRAPAYPFFSREGPRSPRGARSSSRRASRKSVPSSPVLRLGQVHHRRYPQGCHYQTQEKLCWNFGRKRRSVSMGIYRSATIRVADTLQGRGSRFGALRAAARRSGP